MAWLPGASRRLGLSRHWRPALSCADLLQSIGLGHPSGVYMGGLHHVAGEAGFEAKESGESRRRLGPSRNWTTKRRGRSASSPRSWAVSRKPTPHGYFGPATILNLYRIAHSERRWISGITRLAPNCERAEDRGEYCEVAGASAPKLARALFGRSKAAPAPRRQDAATSTPTRIPTWAKS